MSPPCLETKATTTPRASSSSRDEHGGTATPKFKSKLISVTPESPVQLTSGSTHDSDSPVTQVQENQWRGQAIVFGQPLDGDEGVPGLGLFLDGPTLGYDTFETKGIVKKFGSTQESENLPHSMLHSGLQSPTPATIASHSESPMPIDIALRLGGDASVPSIGMEQTDSAQKLALLKEELDAAMSTYKQKVKEVQWYANKVALLDMHYIKALRDNLGAMGQARD